MNIARYLCRLPPVADGLVWAPLPLGLLDDIEDLVLEEEDVGYVTIGCSSSLPFCSLHLSLFIGDMCHKRIRTLLDFVLCR